MMMMMMMMMMMIFCRKSSIPKTLWLIQNEELKAEELLSWCSPSQKLY